MGSCTKCHWADFKNGAHHIHMEPDVLGGQNAPEVRVIQSCAKDQGYFRSYGNMDNPCPDWADAAKFAEKVQAEIDKKRGEWTAPTSRKQLNPRIQFLGMIEAMTEGFDDIYDLLTDVMMQLDIDKFMDFCWTLNDMNIRGGQIMEAFKYCEHDIATLVLAVEQRDESMVNFVNKLYSKADMERAVQSGANLYGHKVLDTKPITKRKNRVKLTVRQAAHRRSTRAR